MECVLNILKEIGECICVFWDVDELSLYGCFDFILVKDGILKILEFNVDILIFLFEVFVI